MPSHPRLRRPAPPADPPTSPDGDGATPEPGATLADDVISRFERTRAGRVLVLAVILVVGSILVIDNLPGSQLKRSLTPVVKPVETNLGLRQNWALFAPNPPRKQSVLLAQLEYSDGSVGTWKLPGWGGITGSYQGYRWRKWGESLLRSKNPEHLRAAARSIASFSERDGVEVTRVVLWRITKQVGDGLDKTIGRSRLISVDLEETK